jgi:hypothetical protein
MNICTEDLPRLGTVCALFDLILILIGGVEGPTSPRIVTGKQHSKAYVDAAHCTVNTFIHEHPNHLIAPFLHGRILLGALLSLELSKEQYLGSLKT